MYTFLTHLVDACSKRKQAIRDGKYGKTSQCWVLMCLDVIKDVYLLHRAVQENNFPLHLFGWKQLDSVGICFE